MRIQYQDLRAPRRVALQEVVPIDTPMLVQLDPANVCNLRCEFCPTGYKDFRAMRNNGIMDWNLYAKIVEDFQAMPHRIKQLTFCKDGEPLMNKHFPGMARLAKDAQIADKLWLKTNGILLTPALNDQLADCGLDLIGISIKQFSPEGYQRVTGVKADYDHLIQMVADLHSKCNSIENMLNNSCTLIYVSTLNNNLTPFEIEKFYADFEPICDAIAIEDLHGWSRSEVKDFRNGNEAETTAVTPKIACPWPLFTLGINFDGQVSACQEDWSMGNIIGDLRTETVNQIWHGAKRREFISTHMLGRRNRYPACAQCEYIQFSPDNIDPYREEILNKL